MAVVDAAPETRPPSSRGKNSKRSAAKSHERRAAIWLIVPSIAILVVVIGYPLVAAVIQSFQKDAGLNATTGMFEAGGFAGFSNYTHWLLQQCGPVPCPPGTNGASFWISIFNTFFFTITTVVLETVLGLWMALIMNRAYRGRALVRASVLVPWAIPTAVTAKLWFFIFATAGIANVILHTQILWTSQTWPARIAIIIADVWKTTPFMALLILAGLQIIPDEIYEASRVDGASTVQQFFRITLPLIKPALMVAILFRTLDALRMYDLPAILTGGGPGNATTTLSILVVNQIRQGFNAAAALSTLTFLLIFGVAFIFVRFLGANVVATQESQQKGELR
jgi:multiple sugar transport system permease protein